MNFSNVSQSRPRKNSSLMCPNTCSVAPLSMQSPLRDMLWTIPIPSSAATNSACWYCQPMSVCMTGLAHPGLASASMESISRCCSRSGCSEIECATISLLPKSYAGAR